MLDAFFSTEECDVCRDKKQLAKKQSVFSYYSAVVRTLHLARDGNDVGLPLSLHGCGEQSTRPRH